MDTLAEEWRKSPLAPNHVEVSNFGRARTLDRHAPVRHGDKKGLTQLRKGVLLSPCVSSSGYLEIAVTTDGKRKKYMLHRLVASVFCEGFNSNLSVNHKDGNKLNNNPDNLEWITLGENTKHQWQIGLVNLRGEAHPTSKIKLQDVFEIRSLLNGGESVRRVAEMFSVSKSTVYKIRSGERWASF